MTTLEGAERPDLNCFDNRVFAINKEIGPTSFDVVSAFRRAARLKKVGHAGTLDPLADGVLLLCTGSATRVVEHFMNLEKEYAFDVYLGRETTTLDAEGETVAEGPCPEIDRERANRIAQSFVGAYDLTPPAFSAVKKDGKRLYELAREGKPVSVKSRRIRIYAFKVESVELPVVRCRIRCSRGTYVRSLARDLGGRIGSPAHVSRLTRLRIGPFDQSSAFPSRRIAERDLEGLTGLEPGAALDFLPGVVLDAKALSGLGHGMIPTVRNVVRTVGELGHDGPVRLLDGDGRLAAIGSRIGAQRRSPLRLVDSYRLLVADASRRG